MRDATAATRNTRTYACTGVLGTPWIVGQDACMSEIAMSLRDPLRTAVSTASFRYQLTRQWRQRDQPSLLTVIMLNPSIADAVRDDRTIRRCISLADAAGADGLRVVNLFALRSTDPEGLRAAPDAIGPENDSYILEAVRTSTTIVAAWGAHPFARARALAVFEVLRGEGVDLRCWGTTKEGHPRHPLYVQGTTPLASWNPRST